MKLVPPFNAAVTVDDLMAVLGSSTNFGLKGALLITGISILQLFLSDNGLLQPLLKGFSDCLATSSIDLGLKLPILTFIYLRIESLLLDFCMLVEGGKVIELIFIRVSILRDEVASEIKG